MENEWDYKGWKNIRGISMDPYNQKNWNSTLATEINKLAKETGIEVGGYVIIACPKHLKHIVGPIANTNKSHGGLYNLDVHYYNTEDDAIEVNGHNLKIINYPKD
jgi:hypothetical protein